MASVTVTALIYSAGDAAHQIAILKYISSYIILLAAYY